MSEVKVNKISPRSGTEVTLGDSGDTFTIPSGATINNQGTATNFGATGSASWVTTVKTSTFTAVAGEGYFVNTTGGVVSVNLPAGTAGAVVAIKDYAGTFDTNKVTLVRNGSDKIGGAALNATLDTEGIAVTLVFIDSTQGWLVTDSGLQTEAPTSQYVTATGGTITTSGDFKIHTFTGPGAFCVSNAGNAAGSNTIDYLVVAGGASGGWANGGGGGGGAGGLRYSASTYCNPTPAGGNAGTVLNASVASFPITVGAGGASITGSPDYKQGNNGAVSTFSTITSAGGGGGGGGPCGSNGPGVAGGSGGGGGKGGPTYGSPEGAGNTPPVSPSQGSSGGHGGGPATGAPSSNLGGGGGGHAASGQCVTGAYGGDGGNGSVVAINGSSSSYAGGGGGNYEGQPAPAQGQGGSGGGGSAGITGGNGYAGTANTGGGGGGTDSQPNNTVTSGAGGSGIVIIRYKFQN